MKDDPKCIWTHKKVCEVRREIRNVIQLGRKLKPTDEMGGIMSGMMDAMSNKMPVELQLLHQFCPLCPYYQKHVSEGIKVKIVR